MGTHCAEFLICISPRFCVPAELHIDPLVVGAEVPVVGIYVSVMVVGAEVCSTAKERIGAYLCVDAVGTSAHASYFVWPVATHA